MNKYLLLLAAATLLAILTAVHLTGQQPLPLIAAAEGAVPSLQLLLVALLLAAFAALLYRCYQLQLQADKGAQIDSFARALPGCLYRIESRGGEGLITYCNENVALMTGRPYREFIGASQEMWLEVIHPGDRQRCVENWQRAIERYDLPRGAVEIEMNGDRTLRAVGAQQRIA